MFDVARFSKVLSHLSFLRPYYEFPSSINSRILQSQLFLSLSFFLFSDITHKNGKYKAQDKEVVLKHYRSSNETGPIGNIKTCIRLHSYRSFNRQIAMAKNQGEVR